MNDVYVLDACALLAHFLDETGADRVETLLMHARQGEVRLFLHAINLYEIYYPYRRDDGEVAAEAVWNEVIHLPLTVSYTFNEPLVREAAEIKAHHRLSVADSFLLAQAVSLNAKVVTSDHHEFDAVEPTGLVRFEWIR